MNIKPGYEVQIVSKLPITSLDDYDKVYKTVRVDGLSKDDVSFYMKFTKLFEYKTSGYMTEEEVRQYLLTNIKDIIHEYPDTAKNVLEFIADKCDSDYANDNMLLYRIYELTHNIFCMDSNYYDLNVLIGCTVFYHEKEVVDITNEFV